MSEQSPDLTLFIRLDDRQLKKQIEQIKKAYPTSPSGGGSRAGMGTGCCDDIKKLTNAAIPGMAAMALGLPIAVKSLSKLVVYSAGMSAFFDMYRPILQFEFAKVSLPFASFLAQAAKPITEFFKNPLKALTGLPVNILNWPNLGGGNRSSTRITNTTNAPVSNTTNIYNTTNTTNTTNQTTLGSIFGGRTINQGAGPATPSEVLKMEAERRAYLEKVYNQTIAQGAKDTADTYVKMTAYQGQTLEEAKKAQEDQRRLYGTAVGIGAGIIATGLGIWKGLQLVASGAASAAGGFGPNLANTIGQTLGGGAQIAEASKGGRFAGAVRSDPRSRSAEARAGPGQTVTRSGGKVIIRQHAAGGMITEPVFGFGATSGMPYSFGEHGPEPVGSNISNMGGITINITVNSASNGSTLANEIARAVRSEVLKAQRGFSNV